MDKLRLFLLGIVISFLGTLPLGYLNITGGIIYRTNGLGAFLSFTTGIIVVEIGVVIALILFYDRISSKIVLLEKLTLFMGTLLILIGTILLFRIYFVPKSTDLAQIKIPESSFFSAGIILNAVNPIQLIFWMPWVLFVNGKANENGFGIVKTLWLIGISLGTFLGFVCIAFLLKYYDDILFKEKSGFDLTILLAITLIIMGVVQIWKWNKKRHA